MDTDTLILDELRWDEIPRVAHLPPEDWHFDIGAYFARHWNRAGVTHLVARNEDGRPMGLGGCILCPPAAWLGQILVEPAARGKGLGARITAALIEVGQKAGAERTVLLATALGHPVYRRLGFLDEGDYLAFEGCLPGGDEPGVDLRPFVPGDAEAVLALDREATGSDRTAQIADLLPQAWLAWGGEGLRGAWIPGLGNGAVLARDPEAGRALLRVKHRLPGAVSTLPEQNREAVAFLEGSGLPSRVMARRMFLGSPGDWRPELVWSRMTGYIG